MRKDCNYDKPSYIYYLMEGDKIRYIGVTNDPHSRYKGHLDTSTFSKNSRKKKWMERLIKAKTLPTMLLIAKFDDRRECELVERHLIIDFNKHFKLYNTRHLERPKNNNKKIQRLSDLT